MIINPIILDELMVILRSREGALFVGAGLSIGAGIIGWDKLIERLRNEFISKYKHDHLTLSQAFETKYNRNELINPDPRVTA